MNENFKKFDSNILVYSLKNHSKIKDKILSYIDSADKFPIAKNNYAVTATDYMLETHPMDREYYKLIKNETTFFEDIRELYKVSDIQVSNIWQKKETLYCSIHLYLIDHLYYNQQIERQPLVSI